MTYTPAAALKWSLSGSGLSTTISAAGNSGGWSNTPSASFPSSPVNIGGCTDVGLFAYCTAKSGSPTLTVFLDVFDGDGNLFPAVAATAGITGTGAAAPVFCGLHGASTGYVVLPTFARVSWTLTGGGSFSGAEIGLWGR